MRFKRSIKRVTILLLAVVIVIQPSYGIHGTIYAQTSENLMDSLHSDDTSYGDYLKKGVKHYRGSDITIDLLAVLVEEASTGEVKKVDNLVGYHMDYEEIMQISLEAPEEGLYRLGLDYNILNDNLLPSQVSLLVNGETQYDEMDEIAFDSLWVTNDEPNFDRYGNEVAPVPFKLKEIQTGFLSDASHRYADAMLVHLNEGENLLEWQVTEGDLFISSMTLVSKILIGEPISQQAIGDELIIIEAEDIQYKTDSSIRAAGVYDVAVTPYSSEKRVLNVLDGDSFKRAGQEVIYEMSVPKAGNYKVALHYKQVDRIDYPVFVDVAVNGTIQNETMKAYGFDYNGTYENEILMDDKGESITVYLEEGLQTISLKLNVEPMVAQIEKVEVIMGEINALALQINKLTGTKSDQYRDFDLEEYIPGIEVSLRDWADRLGDIYEELAVYSNKNGTIGAFSSLDIAQKNLLTLAKKPNELPSRMTEFSNGTTSIIQYLANTIQVIDTNQLSVDKLFLYQDEAELPKGPSILKKMIEWLKRFFYSFTDQSYSVNQTDPDHLQVWINRPRQYVEILQKMIDEDFTAETGIHVDLSIMPDQNKLILANAAGKAPDVAQSIHFALPHDLAIRGALEDLTTYEGYEQTISQYPKGLLIPGMIGEANYSVPETMNFWVMYYRTDILDSLDIPVPNTMEEVTEILPELQRRGMSFYYPSAGMPGIKYFAATMPMIYQYGGQFYEEEVGKTSINTEEAMNGLEALTDLFLIYNAPYDVPSFYQHFRDGSIPIGIAEYGMYNLLLNAAPEISDSWEIGLFPGVEDENGEVQRYTAGAAENSVIFKESEMKDEAWAYLQWMNSSEVQVDFGYTLQTTYGKEFLWNTANIEAFNQLPWQSEHRSVIAEQAQWMIEAPRVPGSYMLERELSNLYNAVVIDGEKLRTAVDEAVKRIDRETVRKLEEFGYMENGVMVKPYPVPSIGLEDED